MRNLGRIPANLIPRRIVFGATGLEPGTYAAKIGKPEGDGPWGPHIPVVILPHDNPETAEHTVTIGDLDSLQDED